MSLDDRARGKALQERLRTLAQRERQRARTRTYDGSEYHRGYYLGLAVGYEEAAKKVGRLIRPPQTKKGDAP